MKIFLLLCLIVVSISIDIPAIGVYTQDSHDYPNNTYIWLSGPRYLELAGAQVVPLFYKSS